jgi:hypothetical protein
VKHKLILHKNFLFNTHTAPQDKIPMRNINTGKIAQNVIYADPINTGDSLRDY